MLPGGDRRDAGHNAGTGEADEPVVYDVSGPSGRLLYATGTGPLGVTVLEAVRDAAFDVVLLDETSGDDDGRGAGGLDLRTFPEQLRRLREVGAVVAGTDVVAVHLSHRNPPSAELSRRLADWGARIVEDGTSLGVPPEPPRPVRTLVLGGARSGKSVEAERLLRTEQRVTYVATAYPAENDDEWAERVRLHRERRPAHWSTLETLDLAALLGTSGDPLLVDCLTLWLTPGGRPARRLGRPRLGLHRREGGPRGDRRAGRGVAHDASTGRRGQQRGRSGGRARHPLRASLPRPDGCR